MGHGNTSLQFYREDWGILEDNQTTFEINEWRIKLICCEMSVRMARILESGLALVLDSTWTRLILINVPTQI